MLEAALNVSRNNSPVDLISGNGVPQSAQKISDQTTAVQQIGQKAMSEASKTSLGMKRPLDYTPEQRLDLSSFHEKQIEQQKTRTYSSDSTEVATYTAQSEGTSHSPRIYRSPSGFEGGFSLSPPSSLKQATPVES